MCPGAVQENSTCTTLNGEVVADSLALAAASLCRQPLSQGRTIFQGFDNSTLDFVGQPGHTYTLLADSYLTVNMQLVGGRTAWSCSIPKEPR